MNELLNRLKQIFLGKGAELGSKLLYLNEGLANQSANGKPLAQGSLQKVVRHRQTLVLNSKSRKCCSIRLKSP